MVNKKQEQVIQKIKVLIIAGIFICSILIAPIGSLYLLYNKNQLTSKSFDKINYLNNEILKLSKLENKEFIDKEELIFKVSKIIDPKVFNDYYFLNDYLYSQVLKEQFLLSAKINVTYFRHLD